MPVTPTYQNRSAAVTPAYATKKTTTGHPLGRLIGILGLTYSGDRGISATLTNKSAVVAPTYTNRN